MDDQQTDQTQTEDTSATAEAAVETPEQEPAETPQEEPKEEPQPKAEKKAAKKVSSDVQTIIEKVEKLSVLELADLVKALEERFGISATPMAIAAPAATATAAVEPEEEKTTFNVILTSGGANKISVIKAVRELVPTLGLKEAKDLVDATPKPVLEGVNKQAAEEAKTKLTAAGGTVELQ